MSTTAPSDPESNNNNDPPGSELSLPAVPAAAIKGMISVPPAIVKEKIKALPDEQRGLIWWLYTHGIERRMSYSHLGSCIKRNANTVYRVLTGGYGARLDSICVEIAGYKTIFEQRENIQRPEFIMTGLATQVWEVCDAAISFSRICQLYGDGQVGKTAALEEFSRRRNHGRTFYVRLPSNLTYFETLMRIGRKLFIKGNTSSQVMKTEILRILDRNSLLIIDELQQITLMRKSHDQLRVLELFKEIFDLTGCSIVLCGTNESRKMIEEGSLYEWLRQLRRRALPPVQLDNVASPKDIATFAAHFELKTAPVGEAEMLVERIARDDGLGLLITYLQAGRRLAHMNREAVTWEHFVSMHAQLNDLGRDRTKKSKTEMARVLQGGANQVLGNGKGGE